jgi:alkylation response protein AidB-like acyl-CoA dehydrogenase
LADLVVPGTTTVLASSQAAVQAFDGAVTEWMVLMANALVGLAARSIEIGVEYVKERKAFGVPIGSFQAVSHGLADAATATQGAGLLAREAAWSADADAEPERTPELAALAFGFASDAAREASYRSEHYHGGYGFMLEYDIQLYFRRARAWPAQFGPADVAYARAAAFRLARRDNGEEA